MTHQTTFGGLFKKDTDNVWNSFTTANSDGVPSNADSAPTFQVLSEAGAVIASGTCTAFASKTGCYIYSFTPSDPGFVRGKSYEVLVDWLVSGAPGRCGFRISLI